MFFLFKKLDVRFISSTGIYNNNITTISGALNILGFIQQNTKSFGVVSEIFSIYFSFFHNGVHLWHLWLTKNQIQHPTAGLEYIHIFSALYTLYTLIFFINHCPIHYYKLLSLLIIIYYIHY